MKPVIAITPAGRDEYAQAVDKAGGLPVVLPLTGDTRALDRFLKCCDGLMLTGGGDIDPRRYGGQSHSKIHGINPTRDAMEIYLAQHAGKMQLPVLGICRGMQVMNVAFGGTLIEHLPGHQGSDWHPLEWQSPRQLPALAKVNTSHHQAVRQVAHGFEVVARSKDNVIEAIERPDAKFFCAVQFHPERMIEREPKTLGLFERFVDAARRD